MFEDLQAVPAQDFLRGRGQFATIAEQVVILNGDIGPLDVEKQESLRAFVENGGGLVCVGDAIEAYHESAVLGEVLGPVHGICSPRTEIIARVANQDHYLTRRVDPTFAVLEAVYLLDIVPPDAEVVWKASWRYATYTLAYIRNYGRGRVFCTALGSDVQTQIHPVFCQMLFRAIHYVSGVDTLEQPKKVAMIGYGAIGFEHGSAISEVPGLEFSLVCDRNEERLAKARQAFPGVNTCTNLQQVVEDPAIEVVFVSTPPNTHAAISMQLLQAGKHVVSEKPFCLTTAEADAMIELAQASNLALTVYQCRRWDPDFLAIQRVLQQQTIGDVFHIETFIGGYAHPCDYWHSHEPISGGVFYDWGSHYLDWILQLVPDPVVSVRGVEHKRVWHDVTNADHSVVHLRFANGQEAEFMHSDIAAAVKPKWYILGTQGAIVGHWRRETVKSRRWSGDLIEERLALSEALPELYVYTRDIQGAIHEQHLMLPESPFYPFHRNLANHLHNAEPLAVPPEESRRNITVMEAAKRSAERGGEVIAIDC
ncbi:MAG TPA: Gfo/Idh/MocA family oxidoreductase [Ktedonobacteraceae bacterium]|jgi:predicted dehydrogenase|nr:Gfo/Idh/MocA family oxidoreductase [Ktedonobacteraceae bacterium]